MSTSQQASSRLKVSYSDKQKERFVNFRYIYFEGSQSINQFISWSVSSDLFQLLKKNLALIEFEFCYLALTLSLKVFLGLINAAKLSQGKIG